MTTAIHSHIAPESHDNSVGIPGATPALRGSKARLWIGRVLTGLSVSFLLFDAAIKLLMIEPVVQSSRELGYPPHTMYGIGAVLLVSTLLYALPRTSPLGALLLTGYLGGAIATHVRVEHPLFSHTLFPLYVAALVWGGLLLRDRRLAQLFPIRRAG